jgi:hypothetical protein
MYVGANVRGEFTVHTSTVERGSSPGGLSYKLQLECRDDMSSITLWFDDGIDALRRYRDEVARICAEHEAREAPKGWGA